MKCTRFVIPSHSNSSFRRRLPSFTGHRARIVKKWSVVRGGEMEHMDVHDLQVRLDAAIKAEDYVVAAQLRDVISERLLDDRAAVEYTNRQFYAAFQEADITLMRSLWLQASHVRCIHPLSGCLAGYDQVTASWEAFFTTIPRGNFRITIEDLSVHVVDRFAVVTCVESVFSGRDIGRIQATNVFERIDADKWNIIHHHGSPLNLI